MTDRTTHAAFALVIAGALVLPTAAAQSTPGQPSAPASDAAANGAEAGVPLPAGYVIGPQDVLAIVFWRDKEMSGDVVVRPDGRISLPLLNDVPAAGFTPEQLRDELEKAASKFVAEPNATVVVKEINSRQVFITGNVAKPSAYPLSGEMTVLQLIAVAGGVLEYADTKNVGILRNENGKERRLTFNYRDVVRGRNPQQNITLQPGDTVIVP